MRAVALCLAAFLVVATTGTPVFAVWPEVEDDDFLIGDPIDFTPGSLRAEAVETVYNPDRQHYLVAVFGRISGNRNLVAWVIDAEGNPVAGPSYLLTLDDEAESTGISAAYSTVHGHYLVAIYNSNLERIQVFFLGENGQQVAPSSSIEPRCSIQTDLLPCGFDLAYDPSADAYLLAWVEHLELFGGPRLRVQLFDGLGSALTSIETIHSQEYLRDVAVAFNPLAGDFLVVWQQFESGQGFEVFGRRLASATLWPRDVAFQISHMDGPGIDEPFRALSPDVAYNPLDDEYLVVWVGDDGTRPLLDDEFEIFGQRLDAAGAEIGPDDFRISDMGGLGESTYDAGTPSVEFVPSEGVYLVAWSGDDDLAGMVDEEVEVFGQFLDREGREVGSNDFRLTEYGRLGDPQASARSPALGFAEASAELLVVWIASDVESPFVYSEIRGQRVDARASIFADGFESGLTTAWSVTVP